ncbi:uncharacterized protein LOC105182527 [Harpegnathos saltator]|uniref:uncharacterized protein LOC105182527 n=1 Tax=Harpegnathos saltator TaxID=610380 RepID=UPI00058C3610|nr:uncharacterized protein LOC105182527 [Harpegnathos saltator]
MAEREQIIETLEASIQNIEIDEEVENTLNSLSIEDDKNIECKTVNGFYFPEFIQSLERIAKEFPIWTATALPGKQTHALTAFQEGYFAELKTKIFEGISLPCSANQFLKEHIDALHSGTNEVAAKLKHFNHNHRQPVLFPHIPEKKSASQKPQVPYSFDEEFLQEPTSVSYLLDNKLGILQDSTSTPCEVNKEFQTSQKPVIQRTLNKRLKLTLKKSAQHSADEESKSSSQQPYINVNFDLINTLHERTRMINDSDLKSGETWKRFINEESCFVDVNEESFEIKEESNSIQDTSQILSELLDLQNDDIANMNQNVYFEPNNNTHTVFSVNDEQDKLFVENGSTITAELSTSKKPFSNTPLSDHNYSKLSDEEVSIEFPTDNQQNLNPKCSKNKPAKVGFYFQSYPQIRFLNERLDNGEKKGFLLRNGLKLGIIKVGNRC